MVVRLPWVGVVPGVKRRRDSAGLTPMDLGSSLLADTSFLSSLSLCFPICTMGSLVFIMSSSRRGGHPHRTMGWDRLASTSLTRLPPEGLDAALPCRHPKAPYSLREKSQLLRSQQSLRTGPHLTPPHRLLHFL